MKDILLEHNDQRIECEINGVELTYTYSSDPKTHYVQKLRDRDAYSGLKSRINDIFNSYDNKNEGWELASELLQTNEFDEYFSNDIGHIYFDIRTREEIESYENEAFDKVWLMRSSPCDDSEIEERRIDAVKRILNTYNDIPEDGYTDWECGYWNGIMGALRWVLGDEKNFLDT